VATILQHIRNPKVIPNLKKLIKMGLKISTISDALAEQCYNHLARLHLIHWMDVAIIYTDTAEYKPLPKPFLTVLERLKLQPKEYSM